MLVGVSSNTMQKHTLTKRLGITPCMHPSAAIRQRCGVHVPRQLLTAPRASLHGPSQPAVRHKQRDAEEDAADIHAPTHTLTARQGGVTDSHIADYRTFFDSQYNEYDYWVDDAWVEGTIPEGLKGTYLQIGAGLMHVFGRQVQHPSDGDGMASSVAFDGAGNVFFRNKYVRTKAFKDEQAAGKPLFRGAFDKGAVKGPAWLFNPLSINYKSETANEGIAYWGGKLYGLSQHGMPHELHKLSMDTIGESTLGGVLGAGKMLSGHSRVVRDASGQQRWVTFGGGQSVNDALVSFWEFDEAGALAASHSYKMRSALGRTLHDISVTPDYYILWQSPLKFNLQKFALEFCRGDACLAECVELVDGEPGKLHLVPRPGGAAAGTKPIVLNAPPLVAYHHVNAFQTTSPNGTTHLTLDVLAMQQADYSNRLSTLSPDTFKAAAKPELVRLVADLTDADKDSTSDGAGLSGRVQARVLSQRAAELAAVHPEATGLPHSYVYCAASAFDDAQHWGPNQVVMKLYVPPGKGTQTPLASSSGSTGMDFWAPGDRCFVNQPTFVPRKPQQQGVGEEDDGWLLCMVHDAETQRASLCILDAAHVSRGPVATLRLPHHLPAAQHSTFVSQYLGPAKTAPANWRSNGAAASSSADA